MKVNVSNMPLGKLYKFDDNRYVIKLKLTETRGGNYPSNEPHVFTEVYQIDGMGFMERIVSGNLINNRSVFDFDKNFAIFDYDQDTSYSFGVTEFKEASLEELYKLRAAVEREYNRRNGK